MKNRKLSELSIKRIVKGIFRRIANFQHELSWIYSINGKRNRRRLEKFKNIHKGERCFLICNGPSLKKTDLNLFKNEYCFGLNRIYLNYPNMKFQPTYLACINGLVLSQFANEISGEKMPLFLNWVSRKNFVRKENIYFVGKGFGNERFSCDISENIYPAATVTYAALQIIHYMGFNEVIIVGMDHNFQFEGKPNECQERGKDNDENHFVPNYFPKGSKWETPDLTSSEYYYKIAKSKFEDDGRKIYDATINGGCYIFDKRELKSFFVGSDKKQQSDREIKPK